MPSITQPSISVVVPAYNEAETMVRLCERIACVDALKQRSFEIVIVNDGSTDETGAVARECAQKDQRVRVVALKQHQGQSLATVAGVSAALAPVVVTIDADLENMPEDISALLEKLEDGWDVVVGWRKKRWQGHFFTRKVPSVVANLAISKISGSGLHDHGCGLKALQKKVFFSLPQNREVNVFLPAYGALLGFRVSEIPVRWQAREEGSSKYGISRVFKILKEIFLLYLKYRNLKNSDT